MKVETPRLSRFSSGLVLTLVLMAAAPSQAVASVQAQHSSTAATDSAARSGEQLAEAADAEPESNAKVAEASVGPEGASKPSEGILAALPPWWGIVLYAVLVLISWSMGRALDSGKKSHFLHSALVGSLLATWLWWVNTLQPVSENAEEFFTWSAMRIKLFDSGWISLAILGTFLACVHALFQIWKIHLIPLNQADLVDQPILQIAQRGDMAALRAALRKHGAKGFYSQRLTRLHHRFERDRDLSAAISLKNDILERDEEDFALAFTAVRWGEVALPLLGFLGTVVGIGMAMGGVSGAVHELLRQTPIEEVAEGLNQGLRGMAVAFDTTFLGLAGLLIVGILHFALRKGLASRLAKARTILSELVANWTGGDASLVVLGGIQTRLLASEGRLAAVEAAIREADRRSSRFQETARSVVERVIREEPRLKSVKDILYWPVVQFQAVGDELRKEAKKRIGEELGPGWSFRSLSVPAATTHTGVAAATSEDGEAALLTFDFEAPSDLSLYTTNERITELLPIFGSDSLLVRAERNGAEELPQSVLLQLQIADGRADTSAELGVLTEQDRLLPVSAGGRAAAFALRRLDPAAVSCDLLLDSRKVGLGPLPQTTQWTLFASHPPTATLFACGAAGNGKGAHRLVATRLVQEQDETSREEEVATGGPKKRPRRPSSGRWRLDGFDVEVTLPGNVLPRSLIALSSETVLVLDTAGFLHLWNTHRPEVRTVRTVRDEKWPGDPQSVVRAGAGGWVAVATGLEKLSMWQIHLGGWMEPYRARGENELTIEKVDRHSLRASLDGRYLFGVGKQELFTWEFPRWAIDEL